MLDEKDGKNMVVINEAAVKAFGWTQPVGKKIDKLGRHYIVKGVIKNISYNAQYMLIYLINIIFFKKNLHYYVI